MTEEELVIFDILTRPAPELSTEERAQAKKVARELLNRLKQLLVLNWRQKRRVHLGSNSPSRTPWISGLPRTYTPDLYRQKCSAALSTYTRAIRRKCGRLRDGGLIMC